MQILKETPICQKQNTVVLVTTAIVTEPNGAKVKKCFLTFKTDGDQKLQTFWTTEDLLFLLNTLTKFKEKELI